MYISYVAKATCYSRLVTLNARIEDRYRRKMFFITIRCRQPEGKRRRWTEAVIEDSKKILGTRNWKGEAMNRQVRRGHIHENKVRYQLLSQKRR
jgi:hypothetical protein